MFRKDLTIKKQPVSCKKNNDMRKSQSASARISNRRFCFYLPFRCGIVPALNGKSPARTAGARTGARIRPNRMIFLKDITGKQPGAGNAAVLVSAALLGTGSFVLYAATACRTIFGGDSCEFTAASCFLGVPHQPGYPLYTMTGRLAAAVSADPVFALNLLSSLFAASGVAVFFLFLKRAYGSMLLSAAGAILLAVSGTYWSLAVVAEVYSLHLLFLTLSFLAALHAGKTSGDLRSLVLASYIAGMGTAHHQSFILALPCLVLLARPKLKQAIPALLAFVFPATLFLFPPLRSACDPLIDYANPETASALFEQLAGGNSRGRLSPFEPATWMNFKTCLFSFLPSEAGPVAAVMAVIGFLSILSLAGVSSLLSLTGVSSLLSLTGVSSLIPSSGKTENKPGRSAACYAAGKSGRAIGGPVHDRSMANRVTVSMLIYLVPVLLFSSSYRIPDPEGFLVPAVIPLISLSVAGIRFLQNPAKAGRAAGLVSVTGAAALLLFPAWNFPRTHFENDRSNYRFIYDYGNNLLKTLEPEAILFVPTEFHYSVLVCLTEIEGFRRDVDLIDMSGRVTRFVPSSLGQGGAHPDSGKVQPATQDSGAPIFDPRGRGRKEVRNRIVASMIRRGTLDRPVYAFDSDFGPVNGYSFHPAGFVTRLSRSPVALQHLREIWLTYSMEGMFDGAVYKKNDNLTNIIPTLEANYTRILSSFLDPASKMIKRGEFDRAENLLDRAASLAPSYPGLQKIRRELELAKNMN